MYLFVLFFKKGIIVRESQLLVMVTKEKSKGPCKVVVTKYNGVVGSYFSVLYASVYRVSNMPLLRSGFASEQSLRIGHGTVSSQDKEDNVALTKALLKVKSLMANLGR